MTTDIEARLSNLSPLQYAVTQQGQTERAFSGVYWDHHGDGAYRCVVCETPLFDSTTKFESGTGWPSFFAEIEPGRVKTVEDTAYGMRRIEATCATCGAHLGHVFDDGPRPTGLRFCMNSASLDFDPRDRPAAETSHPAGEDSPETPPSAY